jgi:tetratricopeptide (TPR) repeat protein
MKKYLLLATLVFFSSHPLFGQQKPKPKQKEAAPTQKEMEAMMKEMKGAMDEMSEEDKKMMDSMGIKMPDMKAMQKNMEGVTDEQLKKAWDDENRIVPLKDAARIASVSSTPLTAASLPAFLSTAQGKVAAQLKPASKTKGEEIYKLIKAQNNSPTATGNTAAGLWMLGKAELALYVMGKACLDNPTNTDNLNNYASMLSMGGAEQLAIPLLDNLNKQFPNNSTILNNLGQAWFGLGDITKAEKYLDDVIRIYAYHPQANYTKSFIEESKGNMPAAVECVRKSIKHGYTREKEERLNKMGYKPTSKDFQFPFKPNPDPLSLSKFKHPDFPKSVDEAIELEKIWEKFKAECRAQGEILKSQQAQAEQIVMKTQEQFTKEIIAASNSAMTNGGYATRSFELVPFHAAKAAVKLKEITEGNNGHDFKIQKALQDITQYRLSMAPLTKKYNAEIGKLEKVEDEQTGEGLANKDFCPEKKALADAYLASYNPGLQKKWETYLDLLKRKLNEETYWYQFAQWPKMFEVTTLAYQQMWLQSISDISFTSITYKCKPKPAGKSGGKLAEFDDVACQYHSEFKTIVGTIKSDCSRTTTELDLKFIKLGLKQDMDKKTFNDQFMSCSVEVGVSAGAGIKNGPLKAEASIGAGVGAEFDRNGLKDVTVKVNAGVSAGTDIIDGGSIAGVGVSDLSADAGVQGQVSLISGKSSVESTGLLQGVFKK